MIAWPSLDELAWWLLVVNIVVATCAFVAWVRK
jgi:hypothetical protein